MSCFIMTPDSTRRLGYTLAAILDMCEYSNTWSIATAAANEANLPAVFRQYFNRVSGYNAEEISNALYIVNVCAFASRYRTAPWEPFPDPTPHSHYKLTQTPVYGDHTESPQEWHYHLVSLLDCWLYQTAEDATTNHDLRKALKAFAGALCGQLVRHSEPYTRCKWGE